MADGPIERMLCSKSRVKSKVDGHVTAGPKDLSATTEHVPTIANNSESSQLVEIDLE